MNNEYTNIDLISITASGGYTKYIRNINVGDKIINKNGKEDTVIANFEYFVNEVIEIYHSEHIDPLVCTPEHRVLVQDYSAKRWIKAKDIRVGDLLVSMKGTKSKKTTKGIRGTAVVRKINSMSFNDPIRIFDIKVDKDPSYVMNNIVVHNCDGYTVFHLHDDTSNCNGFADSCTNYKDYIKLAKKQGMKALAFSNHGSIYDWVKKKQDCDKAGIKYIHGVELYVCTDLKVNERGYHIGLYAKNLDGVNEINTLVSIASSKGIKNDLSDRHYYYNPRISIEELMNTSDNVIVTSACLASMIWKMSLKKIEASKNSDITEEERNAIVKDSDYWIDKMLTWMHWNKHRCFLEVQYHNCDHQNIYNRLLVKYSREYGIRLIAGTDTHSSTDYKAQCRKILQKSKNSYYGEEDEFDLTWKTYEELIEAFRSQGVMSDEDIMEAIGNTNVLADMVEDFELDRSFKYPTLYGDNAKELWQELILKRFKDKLIKGIIDKEKIDEYRRHIGEEFYAMTKQGMESFMLFMAELVEYCNENGIPYGFCRGSVGGSMIAYITDITDVDPIKWGTVFSRFCNADRISLADVDIDFAGEDREKVYDYIGKRYGFGKTAFIAQFGTLKDKGTIDVLAKGLGYQDLELVKQIKKSYEELFSEYGKIIQAEVNLEELEEVEARSVDFDYIDIYLRQMNNQTAKSRIVELKTEFKQLMEDNKDLFYYFDGLKGTIISKGNHPAGMIASPITLHDNMGVFYKDGDINKPVSVCAMKAVDSLNFVKFDILGLKTVGILKDFYKYIGVGYQKAHDIDWNDEKVWENMKLSNVGVFQFEGKLNCPL